MRFARIAAPTVSTAVRLVHRRVGEQLDDPVLTCERCSAWTLHKSTISARHFTCATCGATRLWGGLPIGP
jgi:hypothetical protein